MRGKTVCQNNKPCLSVKLQAYRGGWKLVISNTRDRTISLLVLRDDVIMLTAIEAHSER